ncbi:MAG TPA: RDD family protein [Phenylobacterium sp.]|nr:RDD family protein [Phenylobacterium sp.]
MSEADEVQSGRELFWLRLMAAMVDVVAMVVVVQAAAVLLYWASDGALRSSTLARSARCQPLGSISATVLAGVAVPPGARPVAARLCTLSLAGLETGRYETVALRGQQGEVTRSVAFSRPVDRQGRPVTPVILDWTYPLAFIAAMALGEGLFGATLGKAMVGLRVSARGGGRLPLHRALGRNLVIYGPWAVVLLLPLLAALLRIQLSHAGYIACVAVFGALGWAPLALLAQASPRALYDRWMGADVSRR